MSKMHTLAFQIGMLYAIASGWDTGLTRGGVVVSMVISAFRTKKPVLSQKLRKDRRQLSKPYRRMICMLADSSPLTKYSAFC